jgi:hypothetical protein
MRNDSHKTCTENSKHIFTFHLFFENCTLYLIMWKNIVKPGRLQTTIWRTRSAYWIAKSTNTHSEYAIFFNFALPKWLHECASVIGRYEYNACLVTGVFKDACHFIILGYIASLDLRDVNQQVLAYTMFIYSMLHTTTLFTIRLIFGQ